MPKVFRWAAAVAARVLAAFLGTVAHVKHELFTNGYVIVRLPEEFEGQKLSMGPMAAQRCRNWMKSQLPKEGEGAALVSTIFQKKPKRRDADDGDEARIMGVRTAAFVAAAKEDPFVTSHNTVNAVADWLKKLLHSAYGDQLISSTESLLMSLINCVRQILHCDSNPTEEKNQEHAPNITLEVPPSVSVLVAFEADTYVWAIPGSDKIVRQMVADPSFVPEPMTAVRVKIPKGHAIIFAQDLVHSGDGYDAENLRFHMYFDHVKTKRNGDTTGYLNQLFGEKKAKVFVLPEEK